MTSGADKAIFRINDAIMAIDHKQEMDRNPKLHIGLNPLLLPMRQDLNVINKMLKINRSRNLRKLLVEDYLREDAELRNVDKAYTNTVN